MLRSEAKWFPEFLSLCKDKFLSLLLRREENLLISLLERILTCYSYRQVVVLKDISISYAYQFVDSRTVGMWQDRVHNPIASGKRGVVSQTPKNPFIIATGRGRKALKDSKKKV